MVEEPVEANVVHLTAAGKAKASKKQDQASKSKMTIEEVDATVMSNKPEQPATVEIVERVPVVEPLIVKEEATLLYEGEKTLFVSARVNVQTQDISLHKC